MSIITKSKLSILTESKIGTRMFSTVLNESKRETKEYAQVSVFLSHSHQDLLNGDVDKVIVILRSIGIRVYIDSLDTSLPPFTSEITANKIKEHIRSNKKFILVATNLSINSKWCNWELGYGDAHKYLNNIALFPLADLKS